MESFLNIIVLSLLVGGALFVFLLACGMVVIFIEFLKD